MKQYDITCPICGTLNKGWYLEETGGWMICEHCQSEVMDTDYARKHSKTIPLLRLDQLAQFAAREAV